LSNEKWNFYLRRYGTLSIEYPQRTNSPLPAYGFIPRNFLMQLLPLLNRNYNWLQVTLAGWFHILGILE